MKINPSIFLLLCTVLTIGLYSTCKLPIIEDCALKAAFSYDFTGDSTVVFQNNSDAASDITYAWNFGDNQFDNTAQPPPHRYAAPGIYFVTLTVMRLDCTELYPDTIEVKDGGPIAQFMPNATTYQVDSTVRFQNKSLNADSFAWDFGDPDRTDDVSGAPTPTWVYSRAGSYQVRLIARKAGFEPDTAFEDVTVKAVVFVGSSFNVGSNPASEEERMVGIDQGATGEYYVAIASSFGCFFGKASKTDGHLLNTPNIKAPDENFVYQNVQVNNFKKVSDGYLLPGRANAGAISTAYAYKINLSFTESSVKRLPIDNTTGVGTDYAYDVAEIAAGKYLFCGDSEDKPLSDSIGGYFIHAKSDLSKGWNKTIFNGEIEAEARAILKYSGGYLVAGRKVKSAGSNREACFFKLGNNFAYNNTTLKFWDAPSLFINDIVQVSADRYALVGNESNIGRVRLVDENGTEIWSKPYPDWKIYQVLVTPDNRIIAAGRISQNGVFKAGWMEINPATGITSTYQAHLPSDLKWAEATCIVPTSDGGFLLGGNGESKISTTIKNFLIKTDPFGKTQ